MNKLKVIVTQGLPGSGKSTWAKSMQTAHPGKYKRVNRDDLRSMLDNNFFDEKGKTTEKFIQHLEEEVITRTLNSGLNVIVDNTHLGVKHIPRLRILAEKYDAEFIIKDFTNVPLDVCIARDKERGSKSVGKKVIMGMYNRHLRETADQPNYNFDLPECIICDLDGTLSLINGRSPYDTEKCESDILSPEVAEILFHSKENRKRTIIFVTGSSEKYRQQREAWLAKNGILYYILYMRQDDDKRPDYVVKQEIYETHIKNNFNVFLVLEDRDSVVSMYRDKLGLKVFQVANGDF